MARPIQTALVWLLGLVLKDLTDVFSLAPGFPDEESNFNSKFAIWTKSKSGRIPICKENKQSRGKLLALWGVRCENG